jgi:transcriptional regulator with XRE-family HTH domain
MKYPKLKIKIVESEKFRNQSEFAFYVGTHEGRISQIIHGRRLPTQQERERWSAALGCKPQEIFGD